MDKSITKCCATATALAFLGLGSHLYYFEEVVTILVISGAMTLLPALVFLCGILLWQGYKRIAAAVRSLSGISSLPAAYEIQRGSE